MVSEHIKNIIIVYRYNNLTEKFDQFLNYPNNAKQHRVDRYKHDDCDG